MGGEIGGFFAQRALAHVPTELAGLPAASSGGGAIFLGGGGEDEAAGRPPGSVRA